MKSPPPRPCAWCSTTFHPPHRQTIYCTRTCVLDAAREQRRAAARQRTQPTNRLVPRWDDTVRAECWCGAQTVGVPLAEARLCQTRTCGQPGCRPEAIR